MTQSYELRPIPWEPGYFRVICNKPGGSVGKVHCQGEGWVAINCGDMYFPDDVTFYYTRELAAAALVEAYGHLPDNTPPDGYIGPVCDFCGRVGRTETCQCLTNVNHPDAFCWRCDKQLTDRDLVACEDHCLSCHVEMAEEAAR